MNPTGLNPRLRDGKRENMNAYRVLAGSPAGRIPLGRPKCRWEDIKMDFKEIKLGGGDYGMV
jgi:hypothetical protein